MRAVVLAAVCCITFACRISLDGKSSGTDAPAAGSCMMSTAPVCMDATMNQSLSWIQANIFDKQCTFSGCHDGGHTPAGMVDLTDGKSYAHLVGYQSVLQPSYQLVVAGMPTASYLEVMIGKIKAEDAMPPAPPIPSKAGLMPMDNAGELLCCQKLDAIDRWISMGAMNN